MLISLSAILAMNLLLSLYQIDPIFTVRALVFRRIYLMEVSSSITGYCRTDIDIPGEQKLTLIYHQNWSIFYLN